MTDMTTPPNPAPETPLSLKDDLKDTIRTIVYAVLIALVIRTFAFEPFNIPSASMEPSLLINDFLFVSKYSYGYASAGTFMGLLPFSGRIGGHAPERGDVIVFKWPGDNSTDYIKRLIGLPGDSVQMREGILYINGQPVERDRLAKTLPFGSTPSPEIATDYLEHLPQGATHYIRKSPSYDDLDNTDIFFVPPHHYFFMGDNRDNSADSRAPHSGVGYVAEENLVGKAQIIFFSIDADSHVWQFWKWPLAVRWSRLFTKIN